MAKQIHSYRAWWLVNNVSKSTFIGKNIVSQNSLSKLTLPWIGRSG